MLAQPLPDHGKTLHVDLTSNRERTLNVLKALASDPRLRILELLNTESLAVNQIAQALEIPLSTATMHVKQLEDAELIHTQLTAASRGQQKLCSRRCEQVLIGLPPLGTPVANAVEVAMPIGAFIAFDVFPTCGLASETSIIGMVDDPLSFWEPGRIHAQLIWFRHGHLDYHFPYRLPAGTTPRSVQLRMEVCSEAPTHNLDWPSDITVWANDVELGTWTSPADFGGVRGARTPAWWIDADTQYGQLKRWEVNGAGTFLDGIQISSVRLSDLSLERSPVLRVRIGVKKDARNVGGINLFGRSFGNYPEDIMLRVVYD